MGKFQFTHPGRGATGQAFLTLLLYIVSIHAPREGCDAYISSSFHFPFCFNSRTPGGVRQPWFYESILDEKFQFTHPGRGATIEVQMMQANVEFQFTHPGRGATALSSYFGYGLDVSIHAPREGCDMI